MNQKIKISQLPAKGSNLAAADLLEIAEFTGTGYISKSITGQEIIDAIPVPPSGITIGTTAIASGTVGRVLFEGTGNVVQESANLFWDNTNGRLGIGTSSPAFGLDVVGTARVSGILSTPAGLDLAGWYLYASGTSNATLFGGSSWVFDTVGGGGYRFRTAGNTDRLRIESTGNVLINTTTDAGFRLDVNGTARVQGNAQFGTGFYWDNTNNRLGIGTSSPSTTLHVVGQATISTALSISGGFVMTEAGNVHTFTAPATNRTIRFITNSQSFSLFSTGNFAINTTTDAGFKLDVNGTARATNLIATNTIEVPIHSSQGATAGTKLNISPSNALSVITSGAVVLLNVAHTSGGGFTPTSGTCTHTMLQLASTINQTGGANGITRGLYVNPTLTAAADFRAIETTAGRVIFGGLPTSSAGLSAGDIWNDAGTLKIV